MAESLLAGAAAGSCRLMGNREPPGAAAAAAAVAVCAGAACCWTGAGALPMGNKGCGTLPVHTRADQCGVSDLLISACLGPTGCCPMCCPACQVIINSSVSLLGWCTVLQPRRQTMFGCLVVSDIASWDPHRHIRNHEGGCKYDDDGPMKLSHWQQGRKETGN